MKTFLLFVALIGVLMFQSCNPALHPAKSEIIPVMVLAGDLLFEVVYNQPLYHQRNIAKSEIIPNSVRVNDSLTTSAEAKAFYNNGLEAIKLRNYTEAMMYFTRAIETNPWFATAYYFRGLAKIELKQVDSGCLDLNKAGELGITEAFKAVDTIRKRQELREVEKFVVHNWLWYRYILW